MNEIAISGPWIVAQIVRIRALEAEVENLLATKNPSESLLSRHVAELKIQLALLDLTLN
jgi:hypothetical protein